MRDLKIRRRTFLRTGAATSMAVALSRNVRVAGAVPGKPALLGGSPIRTEPFATWPQIDESYEDSWLEALRAKAWFRYSGHVVSDFEEAYRSVIGTSHCLATANGTSALMCSLNALEVGAGDEVIVPPYTFSATINAVLMQHAVPVFVDTDRETFQMDAKKLEAAITERTRAILPVHLGGSVCDMDAILEIAKKHSLPVVEDACQAHLAEWRGKRVGSLGDTGCFSFQVTKNLSCGDGGAMTTNRDDLYGSSVSFHSNGRVYERRQDYTYARNGCNLRMTEFQGAILLKQLERLDAQSKTRETNAQHLTNRLSQIPGIHPAKMYEGCTRNAYHLYMFRYDPESFAGLDRSGFMKALQAEGIPCSGGYTRLNQEPYVRDTLNRRTFLNVYGKEYIDTYFERNQCPENDALCGEAIWFTQNMLLGPESDMDQIADAAERIHEHANEITSA